MEQTGVVGDIFVFQNVQCLADMLISSRFLSDHAIAPLSHLVALGHQQHVVKERHRVGRRGLHIGRGRAKRNVSRNDATSSFTVKTAQTEVALTCSAMTTVAPPRCASSVMIYRTISAAVDASSPTVMLR
jgi:hypothetical protein